MYWNDHGPPHIHALYQGYEALIEIKNARVIGGHLPPNALRIVREWVRLRQPQLTENWRRARQGKPLQRVAGPDDDR
jgi:hypothetical protein